MSARLATEVLHHLPSGISRTPHVLCLCSQKLRAAEDHLTLLSSQIESDLRFMSASTEQKTVLLTPLVARRWSPKAFSDRHVPAQVLDSLFEAARWAASHCSEQPWRFVIASKQFPEEFNKLLCILSESTRSWAESAPLLLLCCSAKTFEHDGSPNRHSQFDTGAALANMAIQATSLGIYMHQMADFDHERARAAFAIPDSIDIMTAVALGYSNAVMPPDRARQQVQVYRNSWGCM